MENELPDIESPQLMGVVKTQFWARAMGVSRKPAAKRAKVQRASLMRVLLDVKPEFLRRL